MNQGTLSEIGESGWLELLRKGLHEHGSHLIVPIGDDAAVREVRSGYCEILTSDALVEGTHFKKEWLNWKGLAHRAILSAASDVTAMGGQPKGFLLSLGIAADTRLDDLRDFVRSIARLCDETGMTPYGGDTVRSERIFVDVAVVGEVASDRVLRQSGSQPGDALWVTGTLGAARAGWMSRDSLKCDTEGARDRFWYPPCRWPLLECLHSTLPIRAATDLSDGLALDLKKILRGTPCGAAVQLDDLPIDLDAKDYCERAGLDPTEFGFLGGEDFELLIVEKGNNQPTDRFDLGGVPLTRIGALTQDVGTIERRVGVRIVDDPLQQFEHFTRP